MGDRSMWCRSERAQVYARDVRRTAEEPLVFLPRGGADEMRHAARNGDLICPLPDCDQPELTVRAGSRRDHFAHRSAPSSNHAPERVMHVQGKAMIAAWLRGLFAGQLEVGIEIPIGAGKRIGDVVARSPSGRRMVFEVQYSALDPNEWQRRHDDYVAENVIDVWLWGTSSRTAAPSPEWAWTANEVSRQR